MTKKDFIEEIKPMLIVDDKAHNRQVWNDNLDGLSRAGLLNINKAQYWTKSPLKYYGEYKLIEGKQVIIK